MQAEDRDAIVLQRCEEWERMHRLYFPDYDERWEKVTDAVRDRAGDRHPQRVLDLGCGPGTLTRRLLGSLPQATVVGVDADPLLIELARRASPRAQGPLFHSMRIGDLAGDEILRGSGPYDAIVSSAFMHYFSPEDLRSVHRMLRSLLGPDGILVTAELFVDDVAQSELPAADGAWERWWADTDRVMASWPGSFGAARGRAPGEPAPPLTRDGYLRALDATGFAVRSLTCTGPSVVIVAAR